MSGIVKAGIFRVWPLVLIYNLCRVIKDIFRNRKMTCSLAINDFKVRYTGSYLGILWAFIQPMCTIAVFWFVFEMGFKNGAVSDVPYALWLSCGLVPWFFFSDALNGGTGALGEYSYLVKKVVFKIEILPIVKILSALLVHLFFIIFILVLFLLNDVPMSLNIFKVPYYTFSMFIYVIGLSFITSAVVVFFKDLTPIINIVLQFGMWLTPIMWQSSMFPEDIVNIMKINPMFYIIEGYRGCFISTEVAPSIEQTIIFWLITTALLLIGTTLFRRLKPHFADVL